MGDINQFKWIKNNLNLTKDPVLEVGSRHYGEESSFNYRTLFAGRDYVGVDMSEGRNVDLVVDLATDFPTINDKFGGKRFKTIICLSVLEHCPNVFQMCQNLTDLAADDAILFISVPFVWRHHGYPDDYWRFTPSAIRFLFKKFEFDEHPSAVSANKGDEWRQFKTNEEISSFNLFPPLPQKYFSSQVLDAVSLQNWRRGQGLPYLLGPTLINMIGIKKKSGS